MTTTYFLIARVPPFARLAALCLIASILIVINQVHAQTDRTDNEPALTLQEKYNDELDTWMLRAYEGDRDAQFKVGVLFTNDQFSQPDFEQAVYWYKQAARQDHVLAQYNLGHQYLNGVGVKQSTNSAMQWWLKAAKLGHVLAQFNIGRAYYLGIGLEKDHKQAKYWFEQAANNEEPKSIEILQQIDWDKASSSSTAQTTTNDAKPEQTLTKDKTIEPVITPINETPNSAITTVTEVSTPAIQPAPPSDEKRTVQTTIATPNKESIEVITSDQQANRSSPTSSTITLYTNPQVRSVLISVVSDTNQLEILEQGSVWSTVSHKKGFPIWVHSNFISVSGNKGIITGDAVNARSIPLILDGTIIGKLNKNESVSIINKVKQWYRVTSPPRFKAWVRTQDLNNSTPEVVNKTSTDIVTTAQPAASTPSIHAQVQDDIDSQGQAKHINSDKWLFTQDEQRFTIQLASFDTKEKVDNFIKQSIFKKDANLHQFTSKSKGIRWTYFLYGSFRSKEVAIKMQKSLNQKHTWVRNIGRLQQNRCISWKKQLPPPKELNEYCAP